MENWRRLESELRNLRATVAAQDRVICDLRREVYALKVANGVITAKDYIEHLPRFTKHESETRDD